MLRKAKIIVVSHCLINVGTKLSDCSVQEIEADIHTKKLILSKFSEHNIDILQLPCPEFLQLGSNRWGAARSQFDYPAFRRNSQEMLSPIVEQLVEYSQRPERFELLGVIGIEGSPSCGMNLSYDGSWGGDFHDKERTGNALETVHEVAGPGVFMAEFKELLIQARLDLPFWDTPGFIETLE